MSQSNSARSITVPVRVPDEIYAEVRRWAGLKGMTPGDILREAWDQWLAAHKDELLAEVDALRARTQPGESNSYVNPFRASVRALEAISYKRDDPDVNEAIRHLAHGLASLARQVLGEQITEKGE